MTNKLHFQEIDWVIYFPSYGNEGRELPKYGVAFRDRINKVTQGGLRINLGDVLAHPSITDGFPHTIGLFQDSEGRGNNWEPEYIEIKQIGDKEELLQWIGQIEEA